MNPLFQQLGKQAVGNPLLSKIRGIAGAMRGDPMAMLQSNPQAQQILAQYGGDPKRAFYALAQQMGVDQTEVMKTLGM
jgi:hypothetical protein